MGMRWMDAQMCKLMVEASVTLAFLACSKLLCFWGMRCPCFCCKELLIKRDYQGQKMRVKRAELYRGLAKAAVDHEASHWGGPTSNSISLITNILI